MLSEEGLFSVVLSINSETKTLINDPTVVSRGFIYMKGNEEITASLSNNVKQMALSELSKKLFNELTLRQTIIDQLGQIIYELTQRKPLIIPIIVDLK